MADTLLKPKTILINSQKLKLPDIGIPYSLSRRPSSPNSDMSSTTSSLTYENLMRHTVLHALDQHPTTLQSSSSSTSDSHSPHELVNDASNLTPFPSLQTHEDSTDTIDTSPRSHHVHFRPRVRITSGISRHRKRVSSYDQTFISSEFLQDSSLSSSPSSSISAPLRSPDEDDADKPGWGPLGRRVSLLACEARKSGDNNKRRQQRRRTHSDSDLSPNAPPRCPPPCETTPLIPHMKKTPIHFVDGRGVTAEPEEAADSTHYLQSREHFYREIDRTFGPMPYRLFNPQWWRWRLEPIVCCSDEYDVEY